MTSEASAVRIGILCGRERLFPEALIAQINKQGGEVVAEMARLTATPMDEPPPYRVILDRISHEVPFYRAYLTKAVADGVIVVNNPFWWSADNKYVECTLAGQIDVAVPRTVLLPNVSYEADIVEESLRNLAAPNWEEVVAYTGLPAVMKPAIGGGSKNIYIVDSIEALDRAYRETGHLTMIVQEKIEYENYVRCWALGREEVRISGYNYHLPRAERYLGAHQLTTELLNRVNDACLALTRALGYDMDTIELAFRDGVPYAIDFLNPAPDCDPPSVGQENFDWVVERTAAMLVRYATESGPPEPKLNWRDMCAAVPPLRQT